MILDEYWREQAACQVVDPTLFDALEPQTAGPAIAVCARCPVVTRCLAARPDKAGGVWGGLVFNVHGRVAPGRGRPKRAAA